MKTERLTWHVLSWWDHLAQRRGGAGVVDGTNVEVIRRIRENQSDLRLSGADSLTLGLS